MSLPPTLTWPRRWGAALGLALLVVLEAASLRRDELGRRLRALCTLSRLPPGEAILHGTAFGFDRRYGPFLEGVRRATPPGATVAVGGIAPTPGYLYTAAYLLAPRRVLTSGDLSGADFVAVFADGPAPGAPVSASIPDGSLGRLH